ncbi:putative serine/threonine protein phosphatase [Ascosphaera pollenicola]|nr:putative serine/threonine protein phosphatase [Ascosphaera pollenicola]
MTSLEFSRPDPVLFHRPPFRDPPILPAPVPETLSWRSPFPISPHLYAAALDRRVPVFIAGAYAITVILLNKYNVHRKYKPWSISKTRAFKAFVIAHNIFLAVYSAWTFFGMCAMLHETIPSWLEYQASVYGSEAGGGGGGGGLLGYTVAVVDAFTHINGAKGLGNASLFDHKLQKWITLNPSVSPLVVASYTMKDTGETAMMMVPDPNVSGRFWNSGLAYFGWLFYISKFYEVLDTLIILAKGKKSSTLQTYHHAGAMLCMWAGIRYSAAPIWIFPTFNSLIHALMYTYYTLTAFHVPVPIRVKRSLTTMQIMQFILGTAFAASYLCIKYTIPIIQPVSADPLHASTAPAAAATAVGAGVTGMGALVKGFVGRVMNGSSSLAELNKTVAAPAVGYQASQARFFADEKNAKIEYRAFNSVDTPGQAFAVWLNVLYLLPLTWLFARFFVRSYIRRSSAVATVSKTTAAQKTETELTPKPNKTLSKSRSDTAMLDTKLKTDDSAIASTFSSSEETLLSSAASSDDEMRHKLSEDVFVQTQSVRRRRSSATFQSIENAELAGLDALRKITREIRRYPEMQDGTGAERKQREAALGAAASARRTTRRRG